MIRTPGELNTTKQILAKLKKSLSEHRKAHGRSKPGEMNYAIEEGLLDQIDDLEFQVTAYKALESGNSVPLRRLADIGMILAAARIIKNLTQADLAKELEMKQQQIQRYEAADYRGIAMERMDRVVEALGVAFHRL